MDFAALTADYLMFCVMHCAVSLTFLNKFESVDIIFDSRSIAICRRSNSISPISLRLSSLFFTVSLALSIPS